MELYIETIIRNPKKGRSFQLQVGFRVTYISSRRSFQGTLKDPFKEPSRTPLRNPLKTLKEPL